jgi:hypothetical protein
MKFREHLLQLDPRLIVEGEEEFEMNSDDLLKEIQNILELMSDDEIDEFGAFLSVDFFETPEEDIENIYFDLVTVLHMIDELAEEYGNDTEIYEIILDLLLPEDFMSSADYTDDGSYEEEYEEDLGLEDGVNEGVTRIMKVKKLNRKKRKFFTKSAASLRKERAVRIKKNRLNRADRKAYQRINKAKIKGYQKSRATFMKKGRHFKKIRRKAGE